MDQADGRAEDSAQRDQLPALAQNGDVFSKVEVALGRAASGLLRVVEEALATQKNDSLTTMTSPSCNSMSRSRPLTIRL